jgi:demethylmenaquinone methyltransferase/2-methoxy-6-polyprenyl-1,4-benzoquinol methylase
VGLGSYWPEVIDILKEIIPVYDKVNSYISLGKDSEHRKKVTKYLMLALDLGICQKLQ